ncbi:hypothetical protein ACA910_001148 [Epithemia clementina (nom. ined.)]
MDSITFSKEDGCSKKKVGAEIDSGYCNWLGKQYLVDNLDHEVYKIVQYFLANYQERDWAFTKDVVSTILGSDYTLRAADAILKKIEAACIEVKCLKTTD